MGNPCLFNSVYFLSLSTQPPFPDVWIACMLPQWEPWEFCHWKPPHSSHIRVVFVYLFMSLINVYTDWLSHWTGMLFSTNEWTINMSSAEVTYSYISYKLSYYIAIYLEIGFRCLFCGISTTAKNTNNGSDCTVSQKILSYCEISVSF